MTNLKLMSDQQRVTRYTDKFEADFDEIIDYLLEKSPKTASEFAQELKTSLKRIEISPNANPPEMLLSSKQN